MQLAYSEDIGMAYLYAVRQSKERLNIIDVLHQHICAQFKQRSHSADGPAAKLGVSAWGPTDNSFARRHP